MTNYNVVDTLRGAAGHGLGFGETGTVIPSLELWARQQDAELIAQLQANAGHAAVEMNGVQLQTPEL